MFNENDGIAMGDNPNYDNLNNSTGPALILETTNGGFNWVPINYHEIGGLSGHSWRRIDFIDLNHGFFFPSGISDQKLYKTTNACENWDVVYNSSDVFVIKFFNLERGLFLTDRNLKRTTSGGSSWETVSLNYIGWPDDIEFIDEDRIWIVTSENIYFSSDFGDSWTDNTFSDNSDYCDIHFINENRGWLLAYDGVYFTNNSGGITDIKDHQPNNPVKFELLQNFPNPFNPSTKILYSINKKETVRIKVYDLLGKQISVLVDQVMNAGKYSVNFFSGNLPSGVYLYELSAGKQRISRKMVLMR